MLRHWMFPLAVVPMLLLVLVGCAGSDEEFAQDVPPDSAGDSSDTITCPDGLVLWEEYGVCAPFIPECEAWEMPTVDGECVVVGPRACPKAWDPDADVDCEPGDLVPCREGFALTEDEVACVPHFSEDCEKDELPLLGGACLPLGTSDGGSGIPQFDECGPDELPLPGGGCVLPGPRACPKLWDPDSTEDCEVGDLAECPEGWVEDPDGIYCEPVYDACPFGDRPLLGGGCVPAVPQAASCAGVEFPEAPLDATALTYVLSGSPCVESCGSPDAPYPSLQPAIDATPPGGAILVGPGSYPGGLLVSKPLSLIGTCTLAVHIEAASEPALLVQGCDGVRIERLTIHDGSAGLQIDGSEDVLVSDVEIDGPSGFGVRITSGSSATVLGCWVHGTLPSGDDVLAGQGIWLDGASAGTLQDVLIEGTNGAGILVEEDGSLLQGSRMVVRDTEDGGYSTGLRGHGLVVRAQARAEITDSLLERNQESGILVSGSGSDLSLDRSIVRDMSPQHIRFGIGIEVNDGSAAAVRNSVIDQSLGVGIRALDSSTLLMGFRTVVRDTAFDDVMTAGLGLMVNKGAEADISGSVVENNDGSGVSVGNDQSSLRLGGSLIRNTRTDPYGNSGIGIECVGSMKIESTVINGSEYEGIDISGDDGDAYIEHSVVRYTNSHKTQTTSAGIACYDNGAVRMLRSVVENNAGVGIAIGYGGDGRSIAESTIRQHIGGYSGLVVFESGASVSRCLFEQSQGQNIYTYGTDALVSVVDSIVRQDNGDASSDCGSGVQVEHGAAFTLDHVSILGIHGAAISASGLGTSVTILDTILAGGTCSTGCKSTPGLHLYNKAHAWAERVLVTSNQGKAVSVYDAESRLDLLSSVVRYTVAEEDEIGMGIGMFVGAEASVFSAETLFDGNIREGVKVSGEDTEVTLDRCIVQHTHADAAGNRGWGVFAYGGSTVELTGCLVEGNTERGVVANNPETSLSIRGTILRDTKPREDGTEGVGLLAVWLAAVDLDRTLVVGNSSVGVVVHSPGTRLQVSESAIIGTAQGGGWVPQMSGRNLFQSFGDGALASEGGRLDITDTVLMDNNRTGAYFSASPGSVSGCLVARNASYGLAIESSNVAYTDPPNDFVGNAWELPPGQQSGLTTRPQGLPIPQFSIPTL